MINLDTNYLIRCLLANTNESKAVVSWLKEGTDLCCSSIAWYEFMSGPVDENGVDIMSSMLENRILPFGIDEAREAARLFNATGRKRVLRIDAMIAASTIVADACLATSNTDDFNLFEPYGLKLVRT